MALAAIDFAIASPCHYRGCGRRCNSTTSSSPHRRVAKTAPPHATVVSCRACVLRPSNACRGAETRKLVRASSSEFCVGRVANSVGVRRNWSAGRIAGMPGGCFVRLGHIIQSQRQRVRVPGGRRARWLLKTASARHRRPTAPPRGSAVRPRVARSFTPCALRRRRQAPRPACSRPPL